MEIRTLKFLLLLIVSPMVSTATGETVSIASYDFNDGLQGWAPTASTHAEWSASNMASVAQEKSFSSIDPSDKASLYVSAPFESEFRSHSYAVSPEIQIPKAATLNFYAGFSNYFDFACRLILEVSGDDFQSSEVLWNSKYETSGSTSWRWRSIEVDLADLAGRNVKFRFHYATGSSSASADKGGYMGDFAVDNFFITAPAPDENENPGENPGGKDPETDKEAPVASIQAPVEYRLLGQGYPMVPPLVELQFNDVSAHNPTLTTWTFTGTGTNPKEDTVIRQSSPVVSYSQPGLYPVRMVAQNDYGVSMAEEKIWVDWEGEIANALPESTPGNISLGNLGFFPGSNTLGISTFAEKFSRPPVEAVLSEANVWFTAINFANEIDRLASIGLHLYSSKEGKPDVKIASSYLTGEDLMKATEENGLIPARFTFDSPQIIDYEFFLVADGIPAYRGEGGLAIAMTSNKGKGSTALVKQNNEWIKPENLSIPDLNSVSFLISPTIGYAVFDCGESFETVYKVEEAAGKISIPVTSYLPLDLISASDSWLSFSCESDGYSRVAIIAYDALPYGSSSRAATLIFGDGISSVEITVEQYGDAGVEIYSEENFADVFSIEGIKVYSGDIDRFIPSKKGIYIVRGKNREHKILAK